MVVAQRSWWRQVQADRVAREREDRRHAELERQALRELERDAARAEHDAVKLARVREREAGAKERKDGEALAATLNAEIAEDMEELAQLLHRHLATRRSMGLEDLAPAPPWPAKPEPARPGSPPTWEAFAPARKPSLLRPGSRAEYKFAQKRFEDAVAAHDRALEAAAVEAERAWAFYEDDRQKIASGRAESIADRQRFQEALDQLAPDGIEELTHRLLDLVALPERLRCGHRVAYRPEPNEIVVELELPAPDAAVPSNVEVKWTGRPPRLKEVARKDTDDVYSAVIARMTLVVLDHLFLSLPTNVCSRIILNAHLHTIEPSSGNNVHPCLLSVSTSRESFEALVLGRLDPAACLRDRLQSEISEKPSELRAVEPFLEFEKAKWRIGNPAEKLDGLDSRIDLLAVGHRRFEHIVTDLLRAMGLTSYSTPQSYDEGVDSVAFYRDIISGGEFAVQSKQYTRVVPVGDVRELAGAVDVKRATRGFLITTAWASPMAKAFAKENNRIRVIEGGELKFLLKKHLDIDVVIDIAAHRRKKQQR